MPKRGALIAVEGLDRAGKSTQCRLLVERLVKEGACAKLLKFPDRTTPIGTLINTYLTTSTPLNDHAIHLLFSANRWEACEGIKSALASGTTLILDRYIYSGITFTLAKNLPGLDYEYCRSPERGLPRPDAVVFLDVPSSVAAVRAGFGGERYEVPEMQVRVKECFEKMMDDKRDLGDWDVVDAGREVEEVHQDIWKVAEKAVEFAGENELRSFE